MDGGFLGFVYLFCSIFLEDTLSQEMLLYAVVTKCQ